MQKPMDFTVWRSRVVREWPRIEKYQNSTLRYTPPKDFAAFWNKQNGRPSIIRTWVTLDEIWDEETDTYNWNYQIGVDKLGEKRYYPYDWPWTEPSETHFEDYLTSYCAMADEALFNTEDRLCMEKAGLMAYAHGAYYTLGKKIGLFGFSTKKKKKKKIVKNLKNSETRS